MKRLFICVWVLLVIGYWVFPAGAQAPPPRRVNIPYFSTDVTWAETAIFWFGENKQGVPSQNYTDVRVAYTAEALRVRTTVVDYYIWYQDNPPATADLTEYDAVAIYLDTDFDRATTPQTDDYTFLVGAHHWPSENATQYHRQARGTGTEWDTTWTGDWTDYEALQWSDVGPNDNSGNIDYGWTVIFTIPWETLGLAGPPAEGTLWSLGVQLYDRDDTPPAGYVAPEHWPETFDADSPVTWGELHFGYANYQPSTAAPEGTAMIRAATPEDNTVEDAWMGGGGTCSSGHEGGTEINHGDSTALFVGTETAPTHFPCFNKSYLRFSLDAIPPGKTIISASLTLHLWGHAGETPDLAKPSWVHLFTISDPWEEMVIHWNNAPLAQENVSATWVNPYSRPGDIEWPGDPYTWDATQAVAEAYAADQPLSVALYGSDTDQHSSKYLTSSETGLGNPPETWNWNEEGRPTLRVHWGEATAVGTLDKAASPTTASYGQAVTYTLTVVGSNQPVALSDDLPAGVSPPLRLSPDLTYTPHRITWNGTPGLGVQVTLTYVVTVTAPPQSALWNRAFLTQTGSLVTMPPATALVLVDPLRVYLPLVLRE